MNENYKSDLTIVEIAEKFDITDRTLRNIFVNQVGMSPKQYKHSISMNKFKDKLLKSKEDSVTDIFIRCGMRDHSLASKYFKDFFKLTPTEYRNK